jgi:cellulose synthase/poly-beta-1,6-N-acetylglucosamine synthase-like glycosyltransferase/4-amino-4-deoxy-L-arabinose transferase-like glycosyltransferase
VLESRLSSRARRVLGVLAQQANAEGVARPGYRRIADLTDLNKNAIRGVIDELERSRRIAVLRRGNGGCRYRVLKRADLRGAGAKEPPAIHARMRRAARNALSAVAVSARAARPGRRSLRPTATRAPTGLPHARVRIASPVLVGLLLLSATAAVEALWIHSGFVYLLYIGISLLLGGMAATTLVWMMDAWRTPESAAERGMTRVELDPAHSFSLIVPARHEEAVLEATLSRLVSSDHPGFEVLVVVGADDEATREVAEAVADRHPHLVKVIVDPSWPKNKPRALNAALPHCTGTITAVFDAEDIVHPALLRRIDQTFQRTDADVVQAGVQLMNFRSSWLTVRNVLEYYFWFRSRLHVHARQGFIPLGGNTVFVRTKILQAVSGWDPECLAEDCELGVRLSSLGAHTVVVYEPEMVTREECPPTLRAFARQRTRWSQGYLQTLSRGYWRRLPRRQRALGAYILAMPYLMALAWLMIPVALATAIALKAPVPITLISFLPALPILSILAMEVAGLGQFCQLYGERASARDYGRLVFGLPLYQAVLAFASARAVVREARGVRGWEKTAHHGLHLVSHSDGTIPQLGARPARGSQPTAGDPAPAGTVVMDAARSGILAGGTGGAGGSADGFSAASDRLRRGNSPGDALAGQEMVVDTGGPHPTGDGDGNGNGRSGLFDRLPAINGGGPLWMRLEAVSANGSGSLSLPPVSPGSFARDRAGQLRDVPARLANLVRSHADLAVLLPLLVAVGLVQVTNIHHWPGTLFDEGTYVGNAWAVQDRGALAFYTYTYGHPPLAWLMISIWTWVSGIFGHTTYSVGGGREFISAVIIVSCALVYSLARRIEIDRPFAVAAVILFALCPLGLHFHRGVLLDNPAVAWALAAFVLALTPERRLWAFAASGACFALSVLSKETTLVLLPALILAAAQHSDHRTRRYCLTLLVSFLTLIVLGYPLYAALKGEFLPGAGHVSLLGSVIDMLFTRQGTGSVLDPHSVAHGTVMDWLRLDPWLLGAALLFSPIALARRSTRAIALAFLIQVAVILRPGYLPNMYVIALLPFAALIVASAVQSWWRVASGRLPRRSPPADRGGSAASGAPALPLGWGAVVTSGVALVVVAVVAALIVAPRWGRTDHEALTARQDGAQRAAEAWLLANVGREQPIIVTDDFWIYLIEHGFDSRTAEGGLNSRTVVSYWPLDYDPAVKRLFPNGWRDFDYVVSTGAMRVTATYTPNTAEALQHSRVVARFGSGGDRIEVRAIMPTDRSS